MVARWFAFLVWALVAASAAAWGLKLFVSSPPAPAQTQVVAPSAALRGDLTRLFGADAPQAAADAPPEPAASTRFQLVGVVAPRAGTAVGQGLALIAVDGKAARAFRIGAVVEGETVLQSVRARGASLGPRGGVATVALEIPALPPAAIGSLPGADAAGAAATATPARPGSQNRPQAMGAPRLPFNPQGSPPVMQPMSPQGAQAPGQSLQLMPQGIEPGTMDTPVGVR